MSAAAEEAPEQKSVSREIFTKLDFNKRLFNGTANL